LRDRDSKQSNLTILNSDRSVPTPNPLLTASLQNVFRHQPSGIAFLLARINLQYYSVC